MSEKIKVIATLKGVKLQSKVADNNESVHTLEVKLELAEGHERVQEIIESLKEVVEVTIESRQPKLGM